jgi:outer membrane protein assembly factor BamB
MTTPIAARSSSASSASDVFRRARLPLFLGLLLTLALSAAPTPQVDLAALGRRVASLLPRSSAPAGGQSASTQAARLPERVAPHQYLPIVFAKAPKMIYALNAVTGAVRWTHATQEGLNFAQVVNVGVAVEEDHTVTLLSGQNGTPLWRYTPAQGTVAHVSGAYNDTVYAIETHTTLYAQPSAEPDTLLALNDADGSVRWRYTLEHSHLGAITLLGSRGDPQVYFNDDVADSRPTAGSITALDSNNGALLWRRVASGAPGLIPFYVTHDAVIGFAPISAGINSTGGVYFHFDVRTGAITWTLPANQRGAPVFTTTTVYVGSLHHLTAYNIADLSIRWKSTVDGLYSSPLVLGERYVGSRTRTSFAVYDAASGQRLWGRDGPTTFGVIRLVGTTLCANASSDPGSLTGFDVASGTQRWRYQATDTLRPGMQFDGVSLYVRTFAHIYSFNAESGLIQWQTAVNERLDIQMDVAQA